MKKAIDIIEKRIRVLKAVQNDIKQSDGAAFVLTTIDSDVRLSECELLLKYIKEEHDKKRSKSRTSPDTNLSSRKVSRP